MFGQEMERDRERECSANVTRFDDFIDLVCIPGLLSKIELKQIHSLPFIISLRKHFTIYNFVLDLASE